MVTRQVYLGVARDYMVEVADGTSLARHHADREQCPKGNRSLAHAAARPLPGAEPIKQERTRREDAMKNENFQGATCCKARARLDGAGVRTRVRLPGPRAGAAAGSDHAAADRSGEKRRQGGLVHLDRSVGRRKDRPAFKASSRHRRAGRTHRRRAGVPAHRPGICQQRARRRYRQLLRRRASPGWKRQGILLPYVPEDVARHYKPEHRDPDGMFAASAPR